MRQHMTALLCLLGTALLSTGLLAGCGSTSDTDVKRAIRDADVSQEGSLSEMMLTVAQPGEAVNYFQGELAKHPDDLRLKRGLAEALIKAKQPRQAMVAWRDVVATPGATNDDRVNLAEALIRSNEWDEAEKVLATVPPTHETYQRYRLEAMVADYKKQWKKADSFYETAAGLTTTPAGVLNNWGYSKLNRGDYPGAEKLFAEALSYDSTMFTAKNNLVMARAAQHKYDLPILPMTQKERATLLYTAALTAVKQGDVAIGKSLLHEAIETNPEYFEEAARALEALEGTKSAG